MFPTEEWAEIWPSWPFWYRPEWPPARAKLRASSPTVRPQVMRLGVRIPA